MEVYTDGSCITGPDGERYAGSGVWFGNEDMRNLSIPIYIDHPTNQHAELLSIRYALTVCKNVPFLTIKTDSQYSKNCLTVWYKSWQSNGWKTSTGNDVLHSDVIKESLSLLDYRSNKGYITSIEYVKGHSKNPGNDGADSLARTASEYARDYAMRNTIFFSNGIFSQFWLSTFTSDTDDGCITYNCAEQWHHHKKALLFGDTEIADQIMKEKIPYIQKSLGRRVKNFDQDTWNREGLKIAIKGNYYKFSQDKSITNSLKSTKPKRLVEAREDKIWGIGISVDQAKAGVKWNGLNLLGKALMHVRDNLLDNEF